MRIGIERLTGRDQAREAYPCVEGPTLWAEGLPLSQQWFAANLGEHIEGFHLKDLEEGRVIGHIYWAPSERALVPYEIEDRVAFLYCEWVQTPYRGRGLMRRLFGEFIEALKQEGYKGVLVDGTEIEDYMHYSHFAKRGFRVIQDFGQFKLMYLPLAQEEVAVRRLEPKVPVEERAPVEVLIIGSRFCPVGSVAVLLVRKVAEAEEFRGKVLIEEVPATREAIARYGVADGIFINGKMKFLGPVGEEGVRRAIQEELGRTD